MNYLLSCVFCCQNKLTTFLAKTVVGHDTGMMGQLARDL